MVEEAPEELVQDFYFEVIFGKHGLGRPILGTETSIRRMRQARSARVFPETLPPRADDDFGFRKYFARKRQTQEAPGSGAKHAGRAANRARLSRKEFGFEPAPKMREGMWWIKRRTEQVHLVWGVEGVTYSSRDRFAAYLLNIVSGRRDELAAFSGDPRKERAGLHGLFESFLFRDAGVFSVYAATGMNQVPLCLKLIEESVEKLKRELLSGRGTADPSKTI